MYDRLFSEPLITETVRGTGGFDYGGGGDRRNPSRGGRGGYGGGNRNRGGGGVFGGGGGPNGSYKRVLPISIPANFNFKKMERKKNQLSKHLKRLIQKQSYEPAKQKTFMYTVFNIPPIEN